MESGGERRESRGDRRAGGIQPLVAVLRSSTDVAQVKAAAALKPATSNANNQMEIRAAWSAARVCRNGSEKARRRRRAALSCRPPRRQSLKIIATGIPTSSRSSPAADRPCGTVDKKAFDKAAADPDDPTGAKSAIVDEFRARRPVRRERPRLQPPRPRPRPRRSPRSPRTRQSATGVVAVEDAAARSDAIFLREADRRPPRRASVLVRAPRVRRWSARRELGALRGSPDCVGGRRRRGRRLDRGGRRRRGRVVVISVTGGANIAPARRGTSSSSSSCRARRACSADKMWTWAGNWSAGGQVYRITQSTPHVASMAEGLWRPLLLDHPPDGAREASALGCRSTRTSSSALAVMVVVLLRP